MELNTIGGIERFIEDALLSSPYIPLGVNIIRLAATSSEEGIAQMTNSMVIRYVNSSISIQNRQPLAIERKMTFQIIHSSQSYLTESGHDFALQMCAGAYLTLNNTTPQRSGTQVIIPFSMSSESFDGLTDSSHYVYVQNWELTVQEINRTTALDPCVLYGNCKELFASYIGGELLPGDIIFNENQLWSPVLPPPAGGDYDPQYCGVEVKDYDLVYKHDPSVTFLADWQSYKLVSTNTMDESGTFLIVNIYDEEDEFVDYAFYSNCDDRRFVSIKSDLWKNQITNPSYQVKNGLGWGSVWPQTTIYLDPTDADGEKVNVRYGFVFRVETGVHLNVDGEKLYKVNAPQFNVGWVKEGEFEMHQLDRYKQPEDCIFDKPENEGPTECV